MKLLQFKASWCGPCKQQTKEFKENPVNVKLKVIDIDEDTKLANTYNIRSIPTMILLNEQEEIIHRWVGFTTSSTINKFISEVNGDQKV